MVLHSTYDLGAQDIQNNVEFFVMIDASASCPCHWLQTRHLPHLERVTSKTTKKK
jgi:hypothetical protein